MYDPTDPDSTLDALLYVLTYSSDTAIGELAILDDLRDLMAQGFYPMKLRKARSTSTREVKAGTYLFNVGGE